MMTHLIIRELVAKALLNKGVMLGELVRLEDAIEVYERLIRRYQDDDTPVIRELVAKALYGKGTTLWLLQKTGRAHEAFATLIRKFADDEIPIIRDLVKESERTIDQLD